MTETPSNPETGTPDDAAQSVQQQLDRLLKEIETQEPGTIDPSLLPEGFRRKADEPGVAQPDPDTSSEQEVAEAMANFEQAITQGNDAADTTEPQVEADEPAPPTAEAEMVEPAPPPAEPEPEAEAAGETDMLAQLNAALQDLQPDKPAQSEPVAEQPPVEDAPAPADTGEETSSEEELQAEINALLDAPPSPAAGPAESETPAAEAEPVAAEPTTDTEDQLAAEIASLLETEPENLSTAEPEQGDPSIDELDRILADEIDEDEELAGNFESVEAITAGIDTGRDEGAQAIDEHAASASDVAAELDSQPEDRAMSEAANAPATTTHLSAEDDAVERASLRDRWGSVKDSLLRICFAINWPARRYLSTESRANLGYIALLNLFGAAAVWIYLILF